MKNKSIRKSIKQVVRDNFSYSYVWTGEIYFNNKMNMLIETIHYDDKGEDYGQFKLIRLGTVSIK